MYKQNFFYRRWSLKPTGSNLDLDKATHALSSWCGPKGVRLQGATYSRPVMGFPWAQSLLAICSIGLPVALSRPTVRTRPRIPQLDLKVYVFVCGGGPV